MIDIKTGMTIEFHYVNYQEKGATRRAVVIGFGYGATERHPEPQMFMFGFDTEKKAQRTFAINDMSIVTVI